MLRTWFVARSIQTQVPFRKYSMIRLNSGIKNRHNFFLWAITYGRFLYQKVVADSASPADSGDIKVFIQFPGNSILKISLRF